MTSSRVDRGTVVLLEPPATAFHDADGDDTVLTPQEPDQTCSLAPARQTPVGSTTPLVSPPRAARVPRALRREWFRDEGAATAEYVVATMAAVGFAGLLIVILRGDEVRSILTDLVRRALSVG